MDTQQIDVMVADASHEVYVDTILDTIREQFIGRRLNFFEISLRKL